MTDDLKNFIKQHFNKNYQTFRRKYPTEYQQIVGYTSFLPKTSTLRERQFCILNNISSILLCPTCNSPLPWSPQKKKYQLYCSNKCRDKKVIKQKITQTMLDTYGVEHPIHNVKIKEKIKRTNKAKYGDEWNIQSSLHKEKAKKTMLKNHQVEYSLQNKDIREKVKKTMLEKYGVEHPGYRHYESNTLEYLNDNEWLKSQHLKIPLYKIAEMLNVDPTTIGNYFKKHDLSVHGWTFSTGQKELNEFIISLNIKTETNNRSLIPPQELDIYLPEYKLAIEYCGLYWHSEQKGKDRNYHKNKLQRCNDQDIRLLTIYEDEWKNKQQIVQSKIKSIINKDDRDKVYARNTFVVNISHKEKNQFLEENHIQGTGPGSITYGLTNDSLKLVALITFIKQKNQTYYLNRYATSCRVVGGFSKLLKHFQRNNQWNEIISFADLRWSDGNLYEKTGFILDSVLPPDYYYIMNDQRIHKFNFRHKNLPNILSFYNPNLSEKQNTDINNIHRIWNCGLLRYVMRN